MTLPTSKSSGCRGCGAALGRRNGTRRCRRCAGRATGRSNRRLPDRLCLGCDARLSADQRKNGRQYCSRACYLANREQARGAEHHAWKGDEVGYWGRYRRAQKTVEPQACEVCGQPNADRHHRNRNTLDNSAENIDFLCRKHHSELHYREDGPKGAVAQ